MLSLTLRDIDGKIKGFYNSTYDNLVEEFYNPVLAETKRYDRLSGYFRSNSLALAAKGVSGLIRNEGHMRLLCGVQLTPDDVKAVENAEDFKDIIDKNFLGEYKNLEDNMIRKHVQLLGWMIANDFLEIKLGIDVNDYNDYCLDGILHSKKGIFYDESGDYVLFIGSVNETAAGWGINHEEFSVDKSWDGKDLSAPVSDFEKMWNGVFPNLKIMDIPEASKRALIEDAPNDKEGVEKIIQEINGVEIDERKPYFYQREAMAKWFKNDKKGIFEMATGTGKTLTALFCLKKVLEEENVLTIISCPYIHLIEQWKKDVEKLNLGVVHEFYGSSNSEWGAEFDKLKFIINNANRNTRHIILTSHDTFSNDSFLEKLNNINCKLFLIVDEVHHVGASGYGKGLDSKYDYRLGLSATPERYMDYNGTNRIISYFDKIVFTFDIMDALSIRNYESDDNEYFLTPYDYIPIEVNLTPEELNNKSKANNAEHKYIILREILDSLNEPIDHLIIFCSNKQLSTVLKILKEKGVSKHEFTYRQDLKTRMKLLDEFDKGEYQALVAMRCLNEGVDVPSTDKVIIMSSSPNPAENIQRRGRVLRRSKGKDKAFIYDLVVIPDKDNKTLSEFRNTELDRLIEFINTSDNERDGRKFLNQRGLLDG